MIRTDIQVNGTSIDLFEDIPMSFTYNAQDIREPDKRQTGFSKTITIPGTKTNTLLFTEIYDLNLEIQTSGATNFDPDFNPNLKAEVIVYVDTLEQFRGILKLDRVIRLTNEAGDYKLAYECTMFGQLANIFANMGDAKLEDLTFSEFNHTLNADNISNSWATSIVQNSADLAFQLGNGYVYPMIDYGYTNGTTYDVKHFKPAIYVKEYIDKIFAYAGFTYTSTFFQQNYFKRLIIPFNGDALKLSDTQVLNRMFRASRVSTVQGETVTVVPQGSFPPTLSTSGVTVIYNDDSTNPNFDTTNQYNPSSSSGWFTAGATGYYNFETKIIHNYTFNPAGSTGSNCTLQLTAMFEKLNVNGVSQGAVGTASDTFSVGSLGTFTTGQQSSNQTIYLNAPNVYLQAGEKIRVRLIPQAFIGILYGSSTGNFDINIQVGSYFRNSVVNSGLLEGDTVDMSVAVPKDIRMRDFLMSLVKMFNLYIDEDKSTANKLIIEPYTTYYTSGTTVDWSDKLDVGRDLEILPMGALDAKRYRWKYKEDTDYWNDKYQKTYNLTYGEKYLDITNDFLKDEKKTEVIFSPTPLVQNPSIDRIIPSIIGIDQQGNPIPKTSNVRILFYGGMVSTNNSWTFTRINGTYVYSTNTTYPYCGHLDNPITPTEDLSWGVPKEVYYIVSNADQYTNSNLYNKWWKQYIEEITDRNSKIIIGYFYLTPTDIMTLSFQNKIFVDETYFRLNKIIDYDPTRTQLTKVELLKIKNGVSFSHTYKKIYGGITTIDEDIAPTFSGGGMGGVGQSDGYTPPNGRNQNLGTGNRIGGTSIGCVVIGNSNNIGEGCERITIMNSSGCTVYGGVKDAMILNSSGVTIYKSGTYCISNSIYEKTGEKVKTITTDYTVQPNDEDIYCNNTGTITVTLAISNYSEGKVFNIKKLSASGASRDITISGAGIFIDGAGTQTLTTQYQNYTIKVQNSQFYLI